MSGTDTDEFGWVLAGLFAVLFIALVVIISLRMRK